jgi:Halocarboxylic acid dehydrogenase DehI
VSGEFVREIAETAADGSTADVYRDIRRVLEVPVVNLVYRHLATFPGLLEETWWRDLRLNLKSALVTRLAPAIGERAEDVATVPIPRTALTAVGIDDQEHQRLRETLDVYAHANTRNLVAVTALLEGAPGTGQDPGETCPRHGERSLTPLPIVPMSELDAPVVELLAEMGSAVAGTGTEVFVPSLFRHFAHRPALLALFWTALQPAVEAGTLDRAASRVESRARAVAAELPLPVNRIELAGARASLERFGVAIPRMIVAEILLRRSVGALPVR